MTFNASDRREVRRAEKAAKLAEQQDRTVIVALMEHADGRSYLYRKLVAAHVFATSYAPDPMQMAFNEGERNLGLQLLNDLMRFCPDRYIQMVREANGRNSTTTERRGDADSGRDDQGSGDDGSGDYPAPDDADSGEGASLN